MITKGILKNLDKFTNIKLAKGVNIELFVTDDRKCDKNSVGVSTETYGDKWFLTPKGKALFKTYDSSYSYNIRNIRIVNELLCKELCDQIGLDCAEYEPAHIKGLNGLLTYDIAGKNKLVSLESFLKIRKNTTANLYETSCIIDKYLTKGYNINKPEVIKGLYKTILFDTITLQTDRNVRNINFLYNSKTKSFKLAKLIDNEFAFCGEFFTYECDYKNITKYDFSDIIDDYSLTAKIFTFNDSYYANKSRFKNNVEYLVLYAKKYPAFNNLLKETLNNIDVKKAFAILEKNKIEINDEYKEYVCTIVEEVKNFIINKRRQKISKEDLEDLENIC